MLKLNNPAASKPTLPERKRMYRQTSKILWEECIRFYLFFTNLSNELFAGGHCLSLVGDVPNMGVYMYNMPLACCERAMFLNKLAACFTITYQTETGTISEQGCLILADAIEMI